MRICKLAFLLGIALLVGCGYTPRGYLNPSDGGVVIDIANDNPKLSQALKQQFALLGMQVDSDGNGTVRLEQIALQRYKLIGVLSEVRLVLSASASYRVGDVWHSYPVVVSHSYQHNEANLGVDDTEGEQMTRWLYQALASRVAEQYYALNSL